MSLYFNRSRIAGAIVAGGQASRVGGVIKGNLKINNNSIIGHLIQQYQEMGIEEIIIIADDPNPYQDYNLAIIPDLRIDIGPLAGIESGLNYYKGRCDAVLFMPSDMPNITAKEMLALKKAFILTEKPVVYAVTSVMDMHPLCTIVHCDMKEKITSAIDYGQRKILDVWEQVNAGIVQFSDEKVFLNINTPLEIKQLRATYYEKKIYAEPAIADKLREFFNTEKINIEVVSEQSDNIKIVQCQVCRKSDINTIYAGGSITCELARKIASLIGISLSNMGKLMDYLDVKIRRCSLGCFK